MIPQLTLDEAWEKLGNDPRSVLIDVRTIAEWNLVGIPIVDEAGKELRLVEWTTYPNGSPNPNFIDEATQGLEKDQPLLLLCRSGARSQAAAAALKEAGFVNAHNVVAGFEGDLDPQGHRHGGWKDHLPWRQG